MIVDAHAYCFPPLGEANGFPSAREHLRYVQREMADHHQPVWRLTDRAPGHNEMLADPRDRTLRGLREVGFRWRLHGQLRENEPSWIFGPRISARQMLDAEVSSVLARASVGPPSMRVVTG